MIQIFQDQAVGNYVAEPWPINHLKATPPFSYLTFRRMNLLEAFLQTIKKEKLFAGNESLLLAVSGGVDSVVLCELCHRAGFRFSIAHCNFQLRGEESDRDQQFVHGLAARYQTHLMVKKFETEKYAEEHRLSIQVAARELRYSWFEELVSSPVIATPSVGVIEPGTPGLFVTPGFHYLLTAHHADDNIETMLMNFFKGTGIAGLRAMLPKQRQIVRPLLYIHKSAILVFAKEEGLDFVEDSSNATDKYTRNYFRNRFLPAVAQVFPGVEENLSANLFRFREVEILYREAIERHKKKLLEPRGNEVYIPVLKLKRSVPLESITYEIIKDYGFSSLQTREVLHLLDSETGKFVQSASYRIIRHRNWLIIAPNRSEDAEIILLNGPSMSLNFRQGALEITEHVGKPGFEKAWQRNESANIAFLDADKIVF
ncbi:MAG TPA: tRNA lysidine(34) synthetase TilS, partial [Chitinophagaceae bacterium]|nr:tRNA lysidine(34) synthetase TilS [Chitinophagaceae bacterium]